MTVSVAARRWLYSSHAPRSAGGMRRPWHRGQSGQPRPEPVTRTTPPTVTVNRAAMRAAQASGAYDCFRVVIRHRIAQVVPAEPQNSCWFAAAAGKSGARKVPPASTARA